MKDKIQTKLKEHKYSIITVVTALGILVFMWFFALKDTYMPIQHLSSISDGSFTVKTGSVRRIDIKSADGYDISASDLLIQISDGNGNVIHKIEGSGFDFDTVDNKYRTIFDSTPETGIEVPEGIYHISAGLGPNVKEMCIFRVYEYRGSMSGLYLLISISVLLCVIATILVINRKNMSIHRAFIILAVTFGILVNTVFPPLAVPDEASHFKEAYENSSTSYDKLPFKKIPVGGPNYRLWVRATDYDSIYYLHDISSIAGWYEKLWDKPDLSYVLLDYDSTVTAGSTYIYMPAAIGILLARGLRLNGRWLLYLGRFAAFAACLLLVYWAIRLMPKRKLFMLSVALLPQSMFLFMSYSYDGINLALCMFIAAFIMFLTQEEHRIRPWEIIILVASMLVMIPVKMAYIPYILLVLLLISKDCISTITKDRRKPITGIVLLVVFIGIASVLAVTKLPNIANMIGYSGSDGAEMLPESRVSISYAMSNIPDTVKRYFNTFWYESQNYIVQMLGSVPGGLKEGTRSYRMPIFSVLLMIAVFAVALTEEGTGYGRVRKVIVWIAGIGCIFAVYTGLLFGDTKIMDTTIKGIQGRYFLPVLALAPLALKNRFMSVEEDTRRRIVIAGTSLAYILFYFCAYYYYAIHYFWGNE